jgi:hypothetical protein
MSEVPRFAGESGRTRHDAFHGVRCDHAFVEVLIRGIADEKRNAFGQVAGNASGQVDWHFAGPAIDARSACLLPHQSMTTRSLLNAAVKCGVSCFIFSLAAAVFRERQGDLRPAASA